MTSAAVMTEVCVLRRALINWELQPQILEWICSDSCEEPLRFACAEALAALASDNGPGGLDVACAWLGDLLVFLTRGVKTYQSIREALIQRSPSVTTFPFACALDLHNTCRLIM